MFHRGVVSHAFFVFPVQSLLCASCSLHPLRGEGLGRGEVRSEARGAFSQPKRHPAPATASYLLCSNTDVSQPKRHPAPATNMAPTRHLFPSVSQPKRHPAPATSCQPRNHKPLASHSLNGIPPLQRKPLGGDFPAEVSQPKRHPAPATATRPYQSSSSYSVSQPKRHPAPATEGSLRPMATASSLTA